MLLFSGSLRPLSVWLSENRESGARDDQKTRKAPGALDPVVSPSLQGAKYITVTQDTSPSGVNL